jgi:hypothetical protein
MKILMTLIKTSAIIVSLLSACYAQAITINGVVEDKQTSLPVSGAKVTLLKAGLSGTTDGVGKFSLSSDASASTFSDTLVVTGGEYWEKKVPVTSSNTSNLDIKLQAAKQRLIITTDIGGGDPDDQESLVHAILLSDEFDLEGIIYGHAWVKADLKLGRKRIESVIDDYEKVFPNLKVHSDGYPTPEYLRSIVKQGQAEARMSGTGEGKDSDGSNLIIDVVDKKDDPRPVWITAWGGANTIAQAFWKVKNTRRPEQVKQFVNKVRVYDILGQDDGGSWIAKTFTDVLYIRNANGVYGWAPSKSWTAENIQNHGPLGEVYPTPKWAIEGDSPSFFHVASRGLNDPDDVSQGGWGGRFGPEKKTGVKLFSWAEKNAEVNAHDLQLRPYALYTDTSEGSAAISKWKEAIYNDFAVRMDWSITNNYAGANHHPIAVLNGDATRQVLEMTASPGSTVTLDAAGSTDPDHDSLFYSWSFYREPSTYQNPVTLENSSSPSTKVLIPADAVGKTIHIILELRDNGTPNLYAFRRMIISVQ